MGVSAVSVNEEKKIWKKMDGLIVASCGFLN